MRSITARNGKSIELHVSLDVQQSLEHHSQRRLRGVPTISVLVGDGAVAYQAWQEHGVAQAVPTVAWSTESKLPLLETWLNSLVDRCSLRDRTLQYLAFHTNEPLNAIQTRIASGTQHNLDVYWQSLALPNSIDWMKLVLERPNNVSPNRTELALRLAQCLRQKHDQTAQAFNTFLTLYKPNELSSIWVPTHPPGDPRSKDELSGKIVPLVTEVSEAIPSLPIAVSVYREVLDEYLHRATESHAKALFRDGVVKIIASEPVQVASDGQQPDSVSDSVDDDARSENERFLFVQLESRPQTAGIFVLNPKQEYKFGSKRLEIDLFSESYSIAIELDGFHHFQDLEAYRRDRRKDVVLQKLGIFVLRFLSDDVVSSLEQILITIDETIALQQSRLNVQKDQGLQ
jgi:hypothetical protein